MNQVEAPAADWYPDPSGRYQFRYWDGQAWSGHVATDGNTEWDPPGSPPEPADLSDSDQQSEADRPAPEEAATSAEPLADAVSDDVNIAANRRAGLQPQVTAWLDEVAAQVGPRLDRINSSWTTQPQAEAAPACAYGLLLGHLARIYPHMRADLSMAAESHQSFATLESGRRLEILEEIAGDRGRSAAWLGPLVGTDDPERVATLFR